MVIFYQHYYYDNIFDISSHEEFHSFVFTNCLLFCFSMPSSCIIQNMVYYFQQYQEICYLFYNCFSMSRDRGGVSLDTGLCMRNCVVDLVGSACTFSLSGLQPSASRSR